MTILAELALPDAELGILFVNDAQIRELNRRYLRRDRPTNVLAFPMQEGDFAGLHPNLLGDLVISVETAERQSNRFRLDHKGMLTLRQDGARKVLKGVTTIEEVVRVTQEDVAPQ